MRNRRLLVLSTLVMVFAVAGVAASLTFSPWLGVPITAASLVTLWLAHQEAQDHHRRRRREEYERRIRQLIGHQLEARCRS
jgi:hypothetical protein